MIVLGSMQNISKAIPGYSYSYSYLRPQLEDLLVICSVTRLGDFLKELATNFLAKVAQIFGHFGIYFEKVHFLNKNFFVYFGTSSGKHLANFIVTSGHTGHKRAGESI